MGIISLIIIATTTIIIGIATNLFKSDNEVRIREENIKLVDLIGNNMQTTMTSLVLRTKQMAVTIDTKYVTNKKIFNDLFFAVNSDIVFLGVYEVNPDFLSLSNFAADEKFISENKLPEQFFQELIAGSWKSLDAAIRNEVFLFNINRENQTIPFIGIAVPYTKDSLGTKVIISVVKLDNILTSFEKKGIFQTFMVDLNGNILAHSEKEKILFVSNMLSSPIVQELIRAPLNNGQKKFIEEGRTYLGSFKKLDSINAGIISIVPEEKVFEEVYNIRRRNIYISIIALFASLLIVFLFSKTITRPIIDLLNATMKISHGDFKLDIKSKTQDEVGLLTDHFIHMSHGLQEREKVKDALGRFVNPAVVSMVLNNELKLGGENKMVAVLFSDIRSFTSISEQLSPEEVVEFLNQYLTLMVSCVDLTFGVIDKFIGDAIVATWGAVNTLGHPAENAINAALMMRDQLIRFNKNRGSDKKPIIKIGCGLNYGPVIAGQIGSLNRLEYTVIGDTVNLASRTETLNKPFGTDILITQQMYEEVKDLYIVEKMKEILVKGKKEPQTIYAVIGRKDDTDSDSPKTLKELRELLGIQFDESNFDTAGEKEEVKYEFVGKKKRNNMRQLISKFHKAKRYLDNTVFMLTFFILGIMVFSVILYLEFYGNSNGTKNDVIGFVSFKTKSIKRKGISNVVWEDANYKGALAIRDTVRSDEGSSGIFTLNDGTDIKLDENSMIILDIKDKTNSIGLLYGTIQANQNSSKNNSLELKSGDLKIKLKGGSINLTKKENSDVEISVSNGEAVIEKNQKEYNLKEDSLFISRKSEEPRLVETYSIPISPENLKSILVSEKESEITFRWKAKENSSKFQLSLKEDFSSLIQEHIVQGEQFKASLPVGIYYWRLMPVIPNSTFYIQTRKFTISEDFIFDYKFPLKSSIFYLQENPVLINFSWNKIDTAKKYSLEVSKSSAFTETIKRLDTEANALSLDFTEEGNYFFRVRASSKNSDHPEKITSIGSFSIKKQNEISKPNLIAPSNEKKSEPFDRVLFGWESNLSYSSYTLTIAENKELTQNLRVITTKNNFSPLENFKMNTEYFWKVEGKTPSGKSISSNVQSFTTRADGEKELVTNQISKRASDNKSNTTRLNIEKRDEKLKKDDVKTISENGKKKEEKKKELEEFAQLTSPEKEKFFLTDKDSFEIPFLWKTRHKKSQIQFSTKEDFSKLYKQEVVKGIRYKTSLPVGIFYWRIVPVDKKTDFLNPVSRRLTIEKDLPIQFQSPKQKSFTIQNKSVSVPFEWDALDAVDKYTLEISKSPSFTSIYKKVDSEFSMRMIDFTEEGIYYFRIRANLNKPTVREKISQAGSLSIFKKVEIVAPVEIKTTKPEKKEEAKAIEIKKEEPKKEIIKEEVKTFPEEKSIPPKLSAPKSQKKTEVEYEED